MKAESDKRYEAVTYTINGVDKMAYFDSLNDADTWLKQLHKEYARVDIEYAAVIYDQDENRKRVLAIAPAFLLAGKDYH